jgi:hypothetical protein
MEVGSGAVHVALASRRLSRGPRRVPDASCKENGAGDGDRTRDIQLGKRAFYFPEIRNSLKFSRLQIIAIISMAYGLRIARTICTARLS